MISIMHISYSVADNCQNLYDSYGEICVLCNCCGRFDPKTKLKCQLDLNKRMLEETREFDNWADDPELRALQRRNIASDIESFGRKIRELEAKIALKESRHEREIYHDKNSL